MERLLTFSSIPQLAMRRCVCANKALNNYLPLEPGRLSVVATQPDKRLENKTLKKGA